ncbi:MAG: PTS fructose transporter subunit IIA [Chromatiaceae bacterium]|jgi:PTS system ascorbate-specific IIA component|nr:PTS fructose transporter subunit IIA [Chromatiaceae bacterium]
MTVGLLLITHNDIGAALLSTASRMLGHCPLEARTLSIAEDCEPNELQARARDIAGQLDTGEGVLVLTDLFGSTPSNIANALQGGGRRVLSGVNLPMLVRVLNYPTLSLTDMAAKALSGGRDGVLLCPDRDAGRER